MCYCLLLYVVCPARSAPGSASSHVSVTADNSPWRECAHRRSQRILQQRLCSSRSTAVKYLSGLPESRVCVVTLTKLDGVSEGLRTLALTKLYTIINLKVSFKTAPRSALQCTRWFPSHSHQPVAETVSFG